MKRLRIAVAGAGAAGLMSAWLLDEEHDVVVFEGASRVGGHINTTTIEVDGREYTVELGTEFFYEEGYRGMIALIDRLAIARETLPMVVSITRVETGTSFQIPPRNWRALRSCLPPSTLWSLLWMRKLAAAAEVVAQEVDWSMTVRDLIGRTGIPERVANDFILPLIGASWGITCEMAANLSAYSVIRVMGLRLRHEPHSIFLTGGLRSYHQKLMEDSPGMQLRLDCPVTAIRRDEQGLLVRAGGQSERFDAVILACDWHNSAALCTGDSNLDDWQRAFSAFEDYPTRLALHRDPSYMPKDRRLWGNANFLFSPTEKPRTTVWSGFRDKIDVFRTWLRENEAPPASTILTVDYRHILVTCAHHTRQRRLVELQGTAGIWAAGMYTDGIDNHESALRSALRVSERLSPHSQRVQWFAKHVSA